MKTQYLLIILLAITFSGCTQTKYQWGNYEGNLLNYYKGNQTPAEHQKFMEQIGKLIERGELGPKPVPPGIYAEYGYGLFKLGKNAEAIQYFEKEKNTWPESVPLMERLIGNVKDLEKDKASSSDIPEGEG